MPASEDERPQETAPIRVLVANLSGLQSQVIAEAIDREPDLKVVGQVAGQVELLLAVAEGVDLVVIGSAAPYPPPNLCSHLLSEFAGLKILVLAAPTNQATLYWLGLRRRRLPKVSTASLLATIRRAHHINPAT